MGISKGRLPTLEGTRFGISNADKETVTCNFYSPFPVISAAKVLRTEDKLKARSRSKEKKFQLIEFEVNCRPRNYEQYRTRSCVTTVRACGTLDR